MHITLEHKISYRQVHLLNATGVFYLLRCQATIGETINFTSK